MWRTIEKGNARCSEFFSTLGRTDQLMENGTTDALIRSLSRYANQARLVDDYHKGRLEAGGIRQLGPDLVFGRLWQEAGIKRILDELLQEREFEFPVERAIYLTVLHRLFESGSDRAAERWRRDVCLPGREALQLHHRYRAMRWLGEIKDSIEEALFRQRQDMFTELSLAFFDCQWRLKMLHFWRSKCYTYERAAGPGVAVTS